MRDLIIGFCFVPFSLMGQSSLVQGELIQFNSKFETGELKFVSSATVEEALDRANPYVTLADGYFKLELIKVENGKSVELVVKKNGFEVVNLDAMKVVAGQTERVKLYISKQGQITDNKRRYYKIGKTTSEILLEQRNGKLQRELAIAKRNNSEDQDAIRELEKELIKVGQLVSLVDGNSQKLAEWFSRINLDEANQRSINAFKLFQAGKIEEALKLVNLDSIEADAKQFSSLYRRGVNVRDAGQIMIDKAVEGTKKTSESFIIGASLNIVTAEYEKASLYYETAIRYDSLNADILMAYGEFLYVQKKINESLFYFRKTLRVSKDRKQRIDASLKVGNILRLMKSWDALSQYRMTLIAIDSLKSDEGILSKGIAYNGIGNYFFEMEWNFDSVEYYWLKALELKRENLSNDSTVINYHEYLKTVENLVALYAKGEVCSKGEYYGEIATKGYKLLSGESLDYKDHYGKALTNYAMVFRRCRDFDRALKICLESIDVYRSLVKINPEAYEPDLAKVYHNIGAVYDDLHDWKNGEEFLELAYAIRKKYYNIYPSAYSAELCTSIINLCRKYYYGRLLNPPGNTKFYKDKTLKLLHDGQQILKEYGSGSEAPNSARLLNQMTKQVEAINVDIPK